MRHKTITMRRDNNIIKKRASAAVSSSKTCTAHWAQSTAHCPQPANFSAVDKFTKSDPIWRKFYQYRFDFTIVDWEIWNCGLSQERTLNQNGSGWSCSATSTRNGSMSGGLWDPRGSHITSSLRFTQIITKIIKYSHEKPVKNPALWVNLYFR